MRDGKKPIKVYGRSGVVRLDRQVLYDKEKQEHSMPGNRFLPSHQGVIVTRRLQEEACLLATDIPFDAVERLLGWKTGAKSISSNTVRHVVQEHGARIATELLQEAQALLQEGESEGKRLRLTPHGKVRRRPGWPQALNEAVEQALQAEEPVTPKGLSPADWERVLAARREEKINIEELRQLGPLAREDEGIVTLDGVL